MDNQDINNSLANFEMGTIVLSIIAGACMVASFNTELVTKAILYGLASLFALCGVGAFTIIKYRMLKR